MEVLNPEIDRKEWDDKGTILDIRARFADGRWVDVEMQARRHGGLRRRVLYYWARLYAGQPKGGGKYTELVPVEGPRNPWVALCRERWGTVGALRARCAPGRGRAAWGGFVVGDVEQYRDGERGWNDGGRGGRQVCAGSRARGEADSKTGLDPGAG